LIGQEKKVAGNKKKKKGEGFPKAGTQSLQWPKEGGEKKGSVVAGEKMRVTKRISEIEAKLNPEKAVATWKKSIKGPCPARAK